MNANNRIGLTNINNGLRKEVDGLILDIEQGTTLGISFIDRKTKELKTFQLNNNEKAILLSYLNKT